MTTPDNVHPLPARRVERRSHLEWVPIAEMRVPPTGQREFRPPAMSRIARDFDPDKLGYPLVNRRDGVYWIIDGQHRVAALKAMGWGDQQVQCEVFRDLTDAEAAEAFLGRQNRTNVRSLDEFRVAVEAERPRECDIDRVVRAQGLRIAAHRSTEGAVSCVSVLGRLYDRGGAAQLGRALRVTRDAFGTPGMGASVIEGVGLVCIRYQANLDEAAAAAKLGGRMGGVNDLLNRAGVLRKQTGRPVAHCVAAAVVDILNSGKGGRKLTDWWHEDDKPATTVGDEC